MGDCWREVCTPVSEGQRAVQARMLPRPCLSPSQEKEGGGERERVLLALWGYQTSGVEKPAKTFSTGVRGPSRLECAFPMQKAEACGLIG